MSDAVSWDDVPGGRILADGMRGMRSAYGGPPSDAALAVLMCRDRLAEAGLPVPKPAPSSGCPEEALRHNLRLTLTGEGVEGEVDFLRESLDQTAEWVEQARRGGRPVPELPALRAPPVSLPPLPASGT